MLARAHVADRARLLAVAGQARRGQRVERHALGAGRDQRLADAGPPVHRLEGPDMEVLARVRARHQRELGRLEVERVDPAGLDQGHDAERLDAAPEVGDAVRVAEAADQGAVDVDLDDVAAMDALLDPAPDLADEDRTRPPTRGTSRTHAGHGRPAKAAGRSRAGGRRRGRKEIVGRRHGSREDTAVTTPCGAQRRPRRCRPADRAC